MAIDKLEIAFADIIDMPRMENGLARIQFLIKRMEKDAKELDQMGVTAEISVGWDRGKVTDKILTVN